MATNVGGHIAGATTESLLAVALTLRGAQTEVVLCDQQLPACLQCLASLYPKQDRFLAHGPSADLCSFCYDPAEAMYRQLGIPVRRFSEYLTAEDRELAQEMALTTPLEKIATTTLDGIAIGEHALAGALRFFARAELTEEPNGEAVLRRYLHASLLSTMALRRLVRSQRYDAAVMHHGIYVPQGLAGEVCRSEGVRVVTWNPAYRKRCFIFSHDDTYHHTLLSEPVETWENMAWTPAMEERILDYLRSRWQGTQDWIWFHERPQVNLNEIAARTGVDFAKPCIGLLTNVMWDAQLHYPANAFSNMLDWIIRTIRYFESRPDLQLLIRVHPAEIRGTVPSRQRVVDEINRAFPVLPSNVFVVRPESDVSTYAAMSQCNAVIIYGTKTGVELTSMAIPVIVAGEAWIRNKGVTRDASSAEEYFSILDELPFAGRMDPALVQRARKYAYHFFFRRMIPLDMTEPASGNPPYRIAVSDIESLMPGRSPGLDVVCDGILQETPFVFRAELRPTAATSEVPG
jgi:hypothetical protein